LRVILVTGESPYVVRARSTDVIKNDIHDKRVYPCPVRDNTPHPE